MNMHIGMVVEKLIQIKDRNKQNLTRNEVDAINDACNILDKCFLGFDTKEEVVDNTITTIRWKREDIRSCLIENGYEGSDENIDKVLEDSELAKNIDNACIEAGWGPIYARIYDIGSKGFSHKEVNGNAEAKA